jgi:hypothetical protein
MTAAWVQAEAGCKINAKLQMEARLAKHLVQAGIVSLPVLSSQPLLHTSCFNLYHQPRTLFQRCAAFTIFTLCRSRNPAHTIGRADYFVQASAVSISLVAQPVISQQIIFVHLRHHQNYIKLHPRQ